MTTSWTEVALPAFGNGTTGFLTAIEPGSLSFDVKRLYYITNVGEGQGTRGHHAHRALRQAIFCLHGSFRLHLNDGHDQSSVVLDKPHHGVTMEPMVWHWLSELSPSTVVLVVASDVYDEGDYIRDYDDFVAAISAVASV